MENKALLIYDGECPMCQRARNWAVKHVPAERLDTLPCQDETRPQRAPMVSRDACMEAIQLVLPDGRHYSAEKAFPPLLRLTRFGWLYAWIFYLPGASIGYRLIARNRQALSALFVQKKAADSCSIDKGCE